MGNIRSLTWKIWVLVHVFAAHLKFSLLFYIIDMCDFFISDEDGVIRFDLLLADDLER